MKLRYALLLGLGLIGCQAPVPPPQPESAPVASTEGIDRLLTLMNQRLALMHDVAKFKWNEKKPISDPDREKVLLEAMVKKGTEKGLDPHDVRGFFKFQIEAAKLMQQADFDRWTKENHPRFENAVPLEKLRGQIDDLNSKLLEALPGARGASAAAIRERAEVLITGEGINPGVRTTATLPLQEASR